MAAIPIHGSLGILKQVLQVFATGPYHHHWQSWVPFENVVEDVAEAPGGSLGGERGQQLDIRHCTIALHLHTLPRKDVLRGHFGGMDHCCPGLGPHTANPPLGKVVHFRHSNRREELTQVP